MPGRRSDAKPGEKEKLSCARRLQDSFSSGPDVCWKFPDDAGRGRHPAPAFPFISSPVRSRVCREWPDFSGHLLPEG